MFSNYLKFSWNSRVNNIFETMLYFACKSGNVMLVDYLISLGNVDLNEKVIFFL